jgi:hypothetical protein
MDIRKYDTVTVTSYGDSALNYFICLSKAVVIRNNQVHCHRNCQWQASPMALNSELAESMIGGIKVRSSQFLDYLEGQKWD